jgi:CelD/BcsL family acetyltransferase involved in cellulose biosynthesis
MHTMRAASASGYRSFDFCFGGESYKKYFCNEARIVRDAVFLRPGLGAQLSLAAVGLLGPRGEAIRTSIRRRWGAIEACEVDGLSRLRGGLQAARAAASKLSRTTAAA